MSSPTSLCQKAPKRIVSYLAHRPIFVWRYDFQEKLKEVTVFSDANWTNSTRTRKRTLGNCIMHGCHLLRAWSKTQATIAFSSGKSENLAAISAGTEALGMMSLLSDVGIRDVIAALRLDASVALGMLQGKGG